MYIIMIENRSVTKLTNKIESYSEAELNETTQYLIDYTGALLQRLSKVTDLFAFLFICQQI